jgi:hypothetical protein
MTQDDEQLTAESASRVRFGNLGYEMKIKGQKGGKKLIDGVTAVIGTGEVSAFRIDYGTYSNGIDAGYHGTFVSYQKVFYVMLSSISGAGKSTLLDLMSFRKTSIPGGEVSLPSPESTLLTDQLRSLWTAIRSEPR